MNYPEPVIDSERLDKRLEEIRKGKWSDPKKFVFEDLCVYGGLLAISVLLDPTINLFYRIFHQGGLSHPYGFGVLQIGAIALAVIQLVRAWDRWRYHG